ncbi:CBS domain-containing protein [Roseibium salinum]|uniref:CBS domain-containing protein n=1 Tax=Roseibium salinum TaxID=1604349 RepID=A0ABT3QW83_9HYPH|nr:CBS domain-containing protein [Roseibium sp. DSM 29163]MCX2721188.1 CBS domain-containing protein [Roseibium sp. DSM 29163]MDN3722665.1 CBS domain-containing protein [Roseibium salinum]
MKVQQCMSSNVEVCAPDDTIRDVARKMVECDCGVMPIGENDRLVGVVTDRDIAIRAVAEGKGPDTPARSVMSQEVLYCYDDEDIQEVSDNLAMLKIRRMPVVNRDKHLVGIVSLGDITMSDGRAGEIAFRGVSQPGGPHQQA